MENIISSDSHMLVLDENVVKYLPNHLGRGHRHPGHRWGARAVRCRGHPLY